MLAILLWMVVGPVLVIVVCVVWLALLTWVLKVLLGLD